MLHRFAWLALAMPIFSACASEAGASFYIIHNQVPEEECVISPDPGLFRARGIVDALGGTGYFFTPVAQSLVEEAARDDVDRVIFVRGADVTLSFAPGLYSDAEVESLRDDGLANFRQQFSGSIMPGATTSFGFDIIPGAMATDLAGRIGDQPTTVTAEVVMFGQVEGGEATAEPYFYPIDVCVGCLVFDLGDCAALPEDIDPALGGECNPFQDAAVDCCTSDGQLICPAVPLTPA